MDRLDSAEADRTPACACRRPSRPGEHSEAYCRAETTWGELVGRYTAPAPASTSPPWPVETLCDDMGGPNGAGGPCVLPPGHPHVDGIGGQWPAATGTDLPPLTAGLAGGSPGATPSDSKSQPRSPYAPDLDTLVSWVETALDSSDIGVTVQEEDGSASPLRRLVRCLRSAGLLNEDAGDAAETSTEWGVRRDRTGQVNNCGLGGEAFARRTAVCIVSEPVTVVHREVGPWLRAAGTAVPPGQEG